MYQSMKGYQHAGHSVGLYAMNTSRHIVDRPEEIEDDVYRNLDYFQTVKINNSITALGAIRSLFGSHSYVLSRFISPLFERKLKLSIQEYQPDVIQYETLSTAYYIPQMQALFPKIKMVYRMHNVEHKIWQDLAAHEGSPIRKWFMGLSAQKLEKNESEILQDCRWALPIAREDSQWLESHFPDIVQRCYPFAVEPAAPPPAAVEDINFFHIGSMDWEPNIEAMHWWLDEVWPRYKKAREHPFYMAGKNMDAKDFVGYSNLPGLFILGEVPDIQSFLSDKAVLVVPLKSGSGMRIKILEAMQNRKLVISTKEGIAGIEARAGEHYLLAETAEQFLDAMDRVTKDGQVYEAMIESAARLLKEKYNLEKQIELNLEFFQ